MPSSHFDSNADDRHDRDFDRFRRDEARRFSVVSEREISEQPKSTMKFTPTSNDQAFNEWYKEFHLLFEDSHGDRKEVMDIAQDCYDRARESLQPVFPIPLIPVNHHVDDLMGAMAEALRAIHSPGEMHYAGLRFSEELSRRSNHRFAKEMETIQPNQ